MGDRLAQLCRVLNRWKDRPGDFVPEREMGVPGLSVTAVRMVVSGREARELVDALAFFDRCTAYLAGAVMELGCDRVTQATAAARTATGRDGTAEYTARYVMEYRAG